MVQPDVFEVVENLSAPVEGVLEVTCKHALLSSKTNRSLDHPGWVPSRVLQIIVDKC